MGTFWGTERVGQTSRGSGETVCIMHAERAPETPYGEQEATLPTSAGQLQTLSHHAYLHNPLKNLSY